jgi:nucleotide-binding universal stress UspA family protein
VAARGKVSFTTRDAARLYLEERQVEAHYYYEHGNVEDILLRIAGTQKSSLLIMGGYGFSPMLEMVLGSVLDRILREICIPVLICQ